MDRTVFAVVATLSLASPLFAASLEPPETASGPAGGSGLVLPAAPEGPECGPASSAPCPTLRETAGKPATAAPAGAVAKAFKLPNLDGAEVVFNPKALTRPTLVIFWSLFCAPCKEEFPFYGELLDRYSPRGLDLLTVNVDGVGLAKTAKNYLKMQGSSLRVVMDRKEGKRFVSADAYGVTGTPSLFLVDKGGTVRWKHTGRVEPQEIETALRRVLGDP